MAKKEPLYPHKTPSQMKGIPPKPPIEKETTLADFGIPEIRVDLEDSGRMEDWLHPAIANEIDPDRQTSGEVEYHEVIAKMYLAKQKIGFVNYLTEEEVAEIMAEAGIEITSAGAREKATGMGAKIGVLLETPTITSVRTVVLFESSEDADKFVQWIKERGAILIFEGIVWYVKYRAAGKLSLAPPFERTGLVGDTAQSLRIIGEKTGKFAEHDITEVMYDEEEETWRLAIYENEYYAGNVANTLADWLRKQGYQVAGVFNEWAVIFKVL